MLFKELVFSVNPEDNVINLVDIEEPWCSQCFAHSDYKRKWDSLSRANLDGDTYSEISETLHCLRFLQIQSRGLIIHKKL